jgi:hypothetical protein
MGGVRALARFNWCDQFCASDEVSWKPALLITGPGWMKPALLLRRLGLKTIGSAVMDVPRLSLTRRFVSGTYGEPVDAAGSGVKSVEPVASVEARAKKFMCKTSLLPEPL